MSPKQLWMGVIGIAIVAAILSIAGLFAYMLYGPGITIDVPAWFKTATSTRESPLAEAFGTLFECEGGKALKAEFLPGSVNLALSDGRSVRLPDASAGSGTRFANTNETFVFSRSGEIASVAEGGAQTYEECDMRIQ